MAIPLLEYICILINELICVCLLTARLWIYKYFICNFPLYIIARVYVFVKHKFYFFGLFFTLVFVVVILLLMFHSPEVVFLFKEAVVTRCATEGFKIFWHHLSANYYLERIFTYDYHIPLASNISFSRDGISL